MNKFIISSIISCSVLILNSQVGIGTDDPKSILDITSSSSGILIPRMTADQVLNIAADADQNGMLVYSTSTSGSITSTGFWYYDASVGWKSMSSDTGGGGGPTKTVVYVESNGTDITVSDDNEQAVLSETIVLSSVSDLEVEGVVNVKSTSQSIVPELRIEIRNVSNGDVPLDKSVRKGMITTPTIQLLDDLDINGAVTGLNAGTYIVTLYSKQPSCCNVSGLSYITGGNDTPAYMKITY